MIKRLPSPIRKNEGLQFFGTAGTEVLSAVRSLIRSPTHPLSQIIYASLEGVPMLPGEGFTEVSGGGFSGRVSINIY